MVAYERVFEIVFDLETKGLFVKWSLAGGGRLREVVAMRELIVLLLLLLSSVYHWFNPFSLLTTFLDFFTAK